ncbi:MAG: HIT domain-containing protein [Gaiellales bacterium]|nr:MAG: HIT domain-containing protein [Gaiellales bacterium]
MERPIWAPWRIKYILGKKEPGCIFCDAIAGDDDPGSLVLFRGKTAFVIMNLYPYNPGHLMVTPNRHVSGLGELDRECQAEVMDLTAKCIDILKSKLKPHGFNAGFNLGETAGASIKEHLHMHVVPRWQGDNNFMAVLADIDVVPQALEDTYRLLQPSFAELSP